MKLTPSPVKEAATRLGLETIQVEKARDPALLERMQAIAPDVAVVVAYGSILPGALLEVPPKGFVNLHFSLLPLYRGAAPVQRAIMEGQKESGASLMVLTEGMDEGPVLAMVEVPIDPDDTTPSYGSKLAEIGAELMVDVLPSYVRGDSQPTPQDDSLATYAPKLTTEDARIDWTASCATIRDLVRALDPDPGAWTTLHDGRLKVFRVEQVGRDDLSPGSVDAEGGLFVGAADGAVELVEVQPASKKRMPGRDFARGLRLDGDERMGE
jgi:methionyl-tRNA formyltransferase